MEETEEFAMNEINLFKKLRNSIVIYDANEKFLALSQDYESLEIYGFPDTNSDEKKYFEVQVPDEINDLKLNPNHLNILLVGTIQQIEFFIIPEDSKVKIIKSPRFVFDKNKIGFKFSLFNPFNSHIIASSCFDHSIQIWSVTRQMMHIVSCKNVITKMSWQENGELLGFIDNLSQIKIYNNTSKKIIFNLDFKENHINFEFFGYNTILVQTKDKNKIYAYEFGLKSKEEVEIIKKQNYKDIFEEKFNHLLVLSNYFIIHSKIEKNERISLYEDFKFNFYNHECTLNHPKIIKSANKKIIFKILDKDYENNFKLVILEDLFKDPINEEKKHIKEDKYEKASSLSFNSFDNYSEDLNKEYFEDCPNEFIGIIENLHFNYNEYKDTYKKKKKYMDIEEITSDLEKNKNHDLIWLRNNVKAILEKEKKSPTKFCSIKEEYMFYLKLLIQDETNVDLLEKYLKFLEKNEDFLEKEKIHHEKFYDELRYYSVLFEKDKLKNLFNKYEFESEKTKLINLIKDYYTNLNNNTLEQFKEKLQKKDENRYFNQPISLESKELLYFYCYEDIYNFCKRNKSEKNLENKLYILDKIITKDIFGKYEQDDILVPLSCFITFSEPKENVEFFLNSVCSENLTDDELQKKSKDLNLQLTNFTDNNGEKFVVFQKQLFPNPNELCLENINSVRQISEKYNYNYMIKNPPLNLEINKIKKFVTKTLSSRVFKEAFQSLIGLEDYKKIFNDEMISEFVNKLKFLPVKFSSVVAFIDRLSLVAVIPTTKKAIIFSKENVKEKEISLILENAIEVALIYHEFGHAINVVISFRENRLKSNKSPRKKFLKFREGGYYLELLLFGRIIKDLTYGEALYILNEKNYSKSLEEFRKGFKELKNEDLIIDGEFKDLNINTMTEINQLKTSIHIRAKNSNNPNDDLKNIKISIPLRNDVIGREIKESDLEPYF